MSGAISADFGDNITVNTISVSSDTEATANITIGDNAESGARDVKVTTSAGTGTGVAVFRVVVKTTESHPSRTWIWIVVGVAVVVLAGAGTTAYIMLKKRSGSSSARPSRKK